MSTDGRTNAFFVCSLSIMNPTSPRPCRRVAQTNKNRTHAELGLNFVGRPVFNILEFHLRECKQRHGVRLRGNWSPHHLSDNAFGLVPNIFYHWMLILTHWHTLDSSGKRSHQTTHGSNEVQCSGKCRRTIDWWHQWPCNFQRLDQGIHSFSTFLSSTFPMALINIPFLRLGATRSEMTGLSTIETKTFPTIRSNTCAVARFPFSLQQIHQLLDKSFRFFSNWAFVGPLFINGLWFFLHFLRDVDQ